MQTALLKPWFSLLQRFGIFGQIPPLILHLFVQVFSFEGEKEAEASMRQLARSLETTAKLLVPLAILKSYAQQPTLTVLDAYITSHTFLSYIS